MPREKERIRLDRVEHGRGRALGDVCVDGPQVVGEDCAGRSVVGSDVLERGGVARLLRVMIDHQVDAVEDVPEVVRLHIHGGDPRKAGDHLGRHRLHVNVEDVRHPQVLWARHTLKRAEDRRGLRTPQQVAQGQTAGHGIRIWVVVQQNQDAVGIRQVALVLLDLGSRDRPAQLVQQRPSEQVRHAEGSDLGELGAQLIHPLPAGMLADAQHVHERPARIANRFEDPPEASLAVVFDDEAGAWRDFGLEVTIDTAGVADCGVRAGLVEATSQRPVLDQKLHVQAGQQDLV